jgi:hypothetical protein
VIADLASGGDQPAETDDARHSVERAEVLARNRESVERHEACRVACGVDIEFSADAADECRDGLLPTASPSNTASCCV